jgi:hypothetical protein
MSAASLPRFFTDADHAIADAAIIGHPEHQAAALASGTAFSTWYSQLASVLHTRIAPDRGLREWSLIKDIDSGRPWQRADLVDASDWLQRHLAEHTTSQAALATLATQGRTKRIRTRHAPASSGDRRAKRN